MTHRGRRRGAAPSTPAPERDRTSKKGITPCSSSKANPAPSGLHRLCYKNGPFVSSGQEGAYPVGANLWKNAEGDWVPLYEGKMVQAFDHRASGITTVAKNLHRSGQGVEATEADHQDPSFLPEPRYFIKTENPLSTQVAIKDVTSTTNARSAISCLLPPYGAGILCRSLKSKCPIGMNEQKCRHSFARI
jgi:hypothetical protein